MFLSSR